MIGSLTAELPISQQSASSSSPWSWWWCRRSCTPHLRRAR